LAIDFAHKLDLDPQGLAADVEFWRSFKAVFSEEEIVELGHCIACWMGLGRVIHALGLDTVCYSGRSAQTMREFAA
jgi:alkylhydroperoxidase family enzyme